MQSHIFETDAGICVCWGEWFKNSWKGNRALVQYNILDNCQAFLISFKLLMQEIASKKSIKIQITVASVQQENDRNRVYSKFMLTQPH